MRTVTYNAGAYLVEDLLNSQAVAQIHHDGGDIILLELRGGALVSIHLIESAISASELRQTLERNSDAGVYTLVLVWADRMLPGDGQQHTPDAWMRLLLELYHGRIYAYEMYGSEIFVFPAHFERAHSERAHSERAHSERGGADCTVRFGTTVDVAHLHGAVRAGCRVADFGAHHVGTAAPGAALARDPLQPFYDVLGVDADTDAHGVRKAYRLLARRYHPDLNRAHDATAKMQQINAAYDKVMSKFEAQP